MSKCHKNEINITLCNIDPNNVAKAICDIAEIDNIKEVKGKLLTSDNMTNYNTFDNPYNIKPEKFIDFDVKNCNIYIKLPPKSIVSLVVNV